MDKNALHESEKRMKRFLDFENYGKKRYQFIAGFFSGRKGSLLDIGCHKGDLKFYLPEGIEYYGIDSSDNNFENYTKYDLNNKTLPFPDEMFDLINCSAVLEHLFYPYEILSELHRVLKHGGVCVISLPNDKGLNTLFSTVFGKIPDYDKGIYSHHWRFSISTARDFVSKKFKIINERPSFGPLYEKYLPFLKFKFLCTEWFMRCKK